MPNTTNLSLLYPSSTGLVGSGYLNIQQLAEGVDAFYGALTTYTPTFTNITGGAGTFAFRRLGKIGFVSGAFTAGTATAAAAVQLSLPAGWTMPARRQIITAGNDTGAVGVLYGLVPVSGSTIQLYGSAARGVFTAGAALATVFYSGWLELT